MTQEEQDRVLGQAVRLLRDTRNRTKCYERKSDELSHWLRLLANVVDGQGRHTVNNHGLASMMIRSAATSITSNSHQRTKSLSYSMKRNA